MARIRNEQAEVFVVEGNVATARADAIKAARIILSRRAVAPFQEMAEPFTSRLRPSRASTKYLAQGWAGSAYRLIRNV